MDTLKLILLIFQMISCVVLTVVIILQNGAEDGLGAIAGGMVGIGIGMLAKMLSSVDLQTGWPFAGTITPVPAPRGRMGAILVEEAP